MTSSKQPKTAPLSKRAIDKFLLLLTVILIGIGIFMVYDASYASSIERFRGDSFHYVKRQIMWFAIGFIVMLLLVRVPYWRWKSIGLLSVSISATLLAAVFVPHIGVGALGARRWIGHGSIQFQPSEFAKVALVIFLAHELAVGKEKIQDARQGLQRPIIWTVILAALILKEPDMGTAMVLVITSLMMMSLAGAKWRHMLIISISVGAIGTVYALVEPYRVHRLLSFLHPEADKQGAGYQVWHSLIALGTGGFSGLGLGEGLEKFYLPMANTDFIFPVIAEEWGLIGTLVLITLYALIAWRGLKIAHETKNIFGSLLAAGLTCMMTIQALLNIAVVTSSVPNTGIPLPFISYGGSALVMMMASIGMLLNISLYPYGPDAPPEHNRVAVDRQSSRRRPVNRTPARRIQVGEAR